MAKDKNQHPSPTTTTIAVVSNKGGVGKTTTAIQIASGLSVAATNLAAVILIDGDPQGHIAEYLNLESAGDFAAAILGKERIDNCLVQLEHYPRLHIMRGNESTWTLDRSFVKNEDNPDVPSLAARLSDTISSLAAFSDNPADHVLVVIDTAPSYSEVQTSAMIVADYILSPVTPVFGAELGMYSVHDWLDRLNNHKKQFAILPQMYNTSKSTHRRMLRAFKHSATNNVLPSIPYSETLAENMDVSLPIWTAPYLTKTPVAAAYTQVLETLAKQIGLQLKFKRDDNHAD